MFFGTFNHQIDAKSRIRIPAKFSKDLGSTYVLGRSTIGLFAIYSKETIDEISRQYYSPFDDEVDAACTAFFGSCFEVTEDSQGRLQLTEAIKKLFGIPKDLKEVVTVGARDRINVMTVEQYEAMMKNMPYKNALGVLNNAYQTSRKG